MHAPNHGMLIRATDPDTREVLEGYLFIGGRCAPYLGMRAYNASWVLMPGVKLEIVK